MTNSEKHARRLIDLLSRGWDGEFTKADNQELDAFFREVGPEAGQLLLQACAVHLELSKHVASAELYDRAMANVDKLARQEQSRRKQVASPRATLLSPHSRRWAVAALAASAIAAACIPLFHWERSGGDIALRVPRETRLLRPSKPVANLVSVQQAVWAPGSELEVGSTVVENHRLELVSGSAHLSMACGADIVLQAPCTVTLVSDDFARLESGTVTAQVAEWATGFAVATHDLKVIDLGTRFAISADSEGVVEAHVLEGSVLAEPLKKRQPRQSSMLLKSGQAIRVDGLRSRVDLIAARQNDFVGELERFRPLRPIRIWNTGLGSSLGSSDPHWQITDGSTPFGPYPRQAIITDGDTGSYKDNRPEDSQWISVSGNSFPGVAPESTHTFETNFDLTGYDLSSVYVVGYFLVDDAISELRINGHPVEFDRWATTWDVFDFKSFHPIEIADHFVPGENVISIDVYNSPSRPELEGAPNPSALRVEWQAFGCAARNR